MPLTVSMSSDLVPVVFLSWFLTVALMIVAHLTFAIGVRIDAQRLAAPAARRGEPERRAMRFR
jgi:hypothetical protein